VKDLFNPVPAVRQADALGELLARASAEHEAGQRAERASLEHYRKAGEALLRAKAEAGHGNWLDALAKTSIPQQRASEYMRLAEGWDKLPPGGSFALKEALRLIASDQEAAKPPTPGSPLPAGFVLTQSGDLVGAAVCGLSVEVEGKGEAVVLRLPRGDAGVRITPVGLQFFGEGLTVREWGLLALGIAKFCEELERHQPQKEWPRDRGVRLKRAEALLDAQELQTDLEVLGWQFAGQSGIRTGNAGNAPRVEGPFLLWATNGLELCYEVLEVTDPALSEQLAARPDFQAGELTSESVELIATGQLAGTIRELPPTNEHRTQARWLHAAWLKDSWTPPAATRNPAP
jgi:hypothetical protein